MRGHKMLQEGLTAISSRQPSNRSGEAEGGEERMGSSPSLGSQKAACGRGGVGGGYSHQGGTRCRRRTDHPG